MRDTEAIATTAAENQLRLTASWPTGWLNARGFRQQRFNVSLDRLSDYLHQPFKPNIESFPVAGAYAQMKEWEVVSLFGSSLLADHVSTEEGTRTSSPAYEIR